MEYQDYANGVHTAFGYDARGILSQETVSRSGQIYSQRTLYRDDRDRLTAFQKSSNPASNPMENGRGDRFRYDDEGQLMEAWYNAADPANSGAGNNRYDGFNYDAMGNRRATNFLANRGPVTFTRRDNGLNQYQNWSGTPTNYEGNGVLIQEGWIDATYNALNQPVSITSPTSGGKMWFGYDPLGRCVKRWVGASAGAGSNPAIYFYYDGSSLIQEGPSASTISQIYILGNRVDDIVADFAVANNQWMYHHADPRGHAMLLTDSGGNLVEQYEYGAFGQPYVFSSTAQPLNSSTFGNRFLFTGREWLSELKLYDYRARMYHPELGRFMQPDPKHFDAGDYNLYRYCHNDPVNKNDPSGLVLIDNTWQRQMLWQGGGDGTVTEQIAEMHMQNQQPATKEFTSFSDAANSETRNAYNTMRGSASPTEAGADIYQRNDGSEDYRIEKPRLGKLHHDIDDEGEKGKYLGHEIRPDQAPKGYHVAGWLYAHPFYRPKVPAADQRRAHKHGWSAVLVTPAMKGSLFKEQLNIQRYNYPDPPDLE